MNASAGSHDTDHEILAVVDENDRVVGSRTRREIHNQALRHRAVHILVFNPAGCLFLQKRSAHKDVNPGAWDTSAAGHVDFGESYETAAHRELVEELSITSSHLHTLSKISAEEETGWEFVTLFMTITRDRPKPNDHEISDHRWLEPSEVDDLVADPHANLTRSFRRMWRVYRETEIDVATLVSETPEISDSRIGSI